MESMTGYAFLEKNSDQFSFSVEIKTLNSRYLETFINLPKIIRNEEIEIQKMIKTNFERGKVEINVDIYDWNTSRNVILNGELIKKYYSELKKIHKALKIQDPLGLDPILKLDGVSQRERSSLSSKSRKEIYGAIALAIKKTKEMRYKEGMATKKDILNSISEISKISNIIRNSAKTVSSNKVNELKKRIEKISEVKIDEVRLYSEIAIMADKLDINEEVVRLKDHIKKFKYIANQNQQIGRKLDFLAQEMFREINTISSKSNNSEISHMVVDIKNHIDKIREQCRNIV